MLCINGDWGGEQEAFKAFKCRIKIGKKKQKPQHSRVHLSGELMINSKAIRVTFNLGESEELLSGTGMHKLHNNFLRFGQPFVLLFR